MINVEDNFENIIKKYLKEGRDRLFNDLDGTRGAIRHLANDRTRDFMQITDIGFDLQERTFLAELIVNSMYQSFCYGYGIGKTEGSTNKKVFL